MIITSIDDKDLRGTDVHVTDTTLVGALIARSYGGLGTLKVIDDDGVSEQLWVVSNEYGVTHVIRASDYGMAIDDLADRAPTSSVEDLASAMDCSVGNLWAVLDEGDLPDGFYRQANPSCAAGDTGIVELGVYTRVEMLETVNERHPDQQITPLWWVSK